MAVVAAIASVASGVMAFGAAKKQAAAFEEQGRIQRAEAEREAELATEEHRQFEAKQRLAFLKNGVSLAGSPLLVSADTIEKGREQVEAIRRRGVAQQSLASRQAGVAMAEGRASLIGSIGSAAGSLASAPAPAAK